MSDTILVLINTNEITDELINSQNPDIPNKVIVYYTLSGGTYGVLMYKPNNVPDGYIAYTPDELFNYLDENASENTIEE